MLTQLDIENVAVIEKATVEFESGFNAITGETGAGKSLLINSLNMVLGFRAARDLIRDGAQFARVSASFFDKDIDSFLAELDLPTDEGNIIITRKIYPDGRNVCQINQSPVSVSLLKSVGDKLITSHGQRDNAEIFDIPSHVRFLDNFSDNEALLNKYKAEFDEYKNAEKELKLLCTDEQSRLNEIDFLKYQTGEIEKAGLSPNEENELTERKTILENSEALKKSASEVYRALCGDGGARAKRAIEQISQTDSSGEAFLERIANIYYEADDLARDVSSYRDSVEYSPAELNEIDDRLATINSLKRKYSRSVEDILKLYDNASERLSTLLSYEDNKEVITKNVENLKAKAEKTALELSSIRKQKAYLLSERLEDELSELDMPKCKIEFSFVETDLSPIGIDSVELMISTNPSDAPKPITKIASGGEISRVMLAIKSVFCDFDSASTIIFDEVDTGVSGRAAEKIARKMNSLANHFQIISITHLPIIAAAASNHILIEKNTDSDSFKTEIRTLDEKMRENEIARIISGDKINDTALENARQLLGFFK